MKGCNKFNTFSYLSLLFFLLISCKNNNQLTSVNDITGNWMIYEATRNGRPTTTLKDGYIQLGGDNILQTNILGETVQANYQHNDDKIIATNPFPYEFDIINISSDSLHLMGSMRSFNMNFYLIRVDSLPQQDSLLVN